MPITEVDSRTALIIIDLQKGVVGLPTAHPINDVVEKSTALAAEFRRRGLPVVLVNVAGTPAGRTDAGAMNLSLPDDWTDLIPELDQQPDDILLTKYARSAFTKTGLADLLRGREVTQVVVAGVATSGGVESTARDAHEQGFHVTLPVDAMTDSELARHEHAVTQIFPRIAETGFAEDVLAILDRRS